MNNEVVFMFIGHLEVFIWEVPILATSHFSIFFFFFFSEYIGIIYPNSAYQVFLYILLLCGLHFYSQWYVVSQKLLILTQFNVSILSFMIRLFVSYVAKISNILSCVKLQRLYCFIFHNKDMNQGSYFSYSDI